MRMVSVEFPTLLVASAMQERALANISRNALLALLMRVGRVSSPWDVFDAIPKIRKELADQLPELTQWLAEHPVTNENFEALSEEALAKFGPAVALNVVYVPRSEGIRLVGKTTCAKIQPDEG